MKILFFVGPQKTGTSDLYKNFYEKNDSLLIPNGWIYPSCGRTLGPQTRTVVSDGAVASTFELLHDTLSSNLVGTSNEK